MQSLNRLTHRLKKKLGWLVAIVVLGAALYATLLDKLVMQELPRFLPKIEQRITQSSGLKVTIDAISGDLQWLSPRVVLKGIRLYNPNEPDQVLFEIPALTAELNVLSSLIRRGVSLGYLQVDGVKLTLHREEGQWQLVGLQPLLDWFKQRQPQPATVPTAVGEPRNFADKLQRWLPYLYQQRSITLHQWQIEFTGETQWVNRLTELDVRLINAGNEHHLGVSGLWQDTESKEHSTDIIIEYQGSPLTREQFTGDAYFYSPTLDLQPFIPEKPIKGFSTEQLTAGGEFWLSIEQGQLVSLTGDVQVDEVALNREGYSSPVDISDLLARFEWKQNADHSELTLSNIGFNYAGGRMPASNMFIDIQAVSSSTHVAKEETKKEVSVYVDYLSLATVGDFAAGLPLPEEQLETIEALAAKGYLLDIQLQLMLGKETEFQFSTGFNQLGLNPYKKIPGVSGLSGRIELNKHAGWVDIDTTGPFSISPKTLYSNALEGTLLNGAAYWSKDHTGAVDVKTSFIHLVTEYANADTLFNIYGIKKGQIPELAVVATIHEGDAAAAALYTPDQKLSTGLVTWLNESIKGGEIRSAGLIINGPARVKPDQYYAKTLQLLFPVKQAQLEFLPDWPSLKNLQAEVLIEPTKPATNPKNKRQNRR